MKILKLAVLSLSILTTITLQPALVNQSRDLYAKTMELDCLAKNIYHEARGEPLKGQIAVAQVTINRVRSGKFQDTVCGTVFAYKQFSWTLDKSKKIKDMKAWKISVDVAKIALNKSIKLPEFKAMYFHTKQTNPYWKHNKRVLARIGNHIFYA